MSKFDNTFSIADVSAIYQVDTETVLDWISNKELSAITVDGRYRVTQEALKEFNSKRETAESTTE